MTHDSMLEYNIYVIVLHSLNLVRRAYNSYIAYNSLNKFNRSKNNHAAQRKLYTILSILDQILRQSTKIPSFIRWLLNFTYNAMLLRAQFNVHLPGVVKLSKFNAIHTLKVSKVEVVKDDVNSHLETTAHAIKAKFTSPPASKNVSKR